MEFVNVFKKLMQSLVYLTIGQLMKEVPFSKSQFYQWLDHVEERKLREPKLIPQDTAENAVGVIFKYPHLSGPKGQAYMIYHRLGYIPIHFYKKLKKVVKRLIFQEASRRNLLPDRVSYEHERPERPGQIWAEDFTQIIVCGKKFYICLLIDVFDSFYLGVAVGERVNAKLVETPVVQALEHGDGKGPKRFLLSDNGSEYVSDEHGKLLEKQSIVHKRIPACKPEYNGSIECGVKEFKNVFYNVWAEKESQYADKGKSLLERVQAAVEDTQTRMNYELPRPCLKGVTPGDVESGKFLEKMEQNRNYAEEERKRKIAPWTKDIWRLVKEALFENPPGDLEIMTKFSFFLKRPLRKLPKLTMGVSGN